jgi:hypothetical protein
VVFRPLDRPILAPRLRAAALMPAAVLTVHQLRFMLAFGGASGEELEKEGHQYLSALAAPIAMSVAIVVGLFFAWLASAWREKEGSQTTPAGGALGELASRFGGTRDPASWRGFLRLALLIAASLLVLYSCQELLEGMLSNGHPEGLDGVFGDGGWWAAPLSLLFGLAIAAALRGARAAIRWVVSRRRRPTTPHGRPTPASRPRHLVLPRLVPLAGAAAGRAPPLAS